MANEFLKLHIGEGKEIDIELPLSYHQNMDTEEVPLVLQEQKEETGIPLDAESVKRTLIKRGFPIGKVILGNTTSLENGVLTVREELTAEAKAADSLVMNVEMDIVTPDMHDRYTNTIMDFSPIAVKKEGKIGEGITNVLDGVVMMLTGVDESGNQVADANASNGIIGERIMFDRPGSPKRDDILLRIHITIKDGYRMERPGPFAAHKAADCIVEEIRQVLKEKEEREASYVKQYEDITRHEKPKVILVKEIMGQGAMHDNLILPMEPAGFLGGRPNVDLGNLPVLLTPNEVLDGGIHALTCITPDTKETTMAYWQEPFVERLANDEEFNFLGVIFIGSPQANTEKFYVSERLGRWVEVMDIKGAIVTTEGFGNNHIDFASHIEQIGSLDVPVVGVSFCGVQGALVVGNKYMDAMVDLAVSENGVNSDCLSENSVSKEAALRAVAMLKDKMMGIEVEKAPKEWVEAVQDTNYERAKESHNDD